MQDNIKNLRYSGLIILLLIASFFLINFDQNINSPILFYYSFFCILIVIFIFFFPKFFIFPNYLLIKLGIIFSKIFNPLFFSLIYFLLVSPIGIYYRLKFKKKVSSWIINKNNRFFENDFFENEY